MIVEQTQLKLVKSRLTGELIGFVSRNPQSEKLMGVREDSRYGKKICILARELHGTLVENKLYNVVMKPMHKRSGFVIISAEPMAFEANIELHITPHKCYQIRVVFGNKIIYFDPLYGNNYSSNSIEGVVKMIRQRDDIASKELVIDCFIGRARQLISLIEADGYTITPL